MGSKDEGNEEKDGSYGECNEGINDYTKQPSPSQ